METPTQTRRAAELAWIRLMRVYFQIDHGTARVLKPHGLSVGRFDVLVHAGAQEGRTQQELADATFATKGNICQLLDSMEKEGLLYRRRKGRTNLIYLTDAGRDLRRKALADQLDHIESAMGALTTDEQQTLHNLLRKIDRSLEAAH